MKNQIAKGEWLNKGGNFAIVTAGWKGTLPAGVERIETPTAQKEQSTIVKARSWNCLSSSALCSTRG